MPAAPVGQPPSQQPVTTKKPPTASELEKTEIGCMLGAFRDVAQSIGMQVMAVTLEVASTTEQPNPAGPSVLPKKRPRRDKKLIALVQTFADNVLMIGFKLVQIDMKPVPRVQVDERKKWRIRVDLVTSDGEPVAEPSGA